MLTVRLDPRHLRMTDSFLFISIQDRGLPFKRTRRGGGGYFVFLHNLMYSLTEEHFIPDLLAS